MTDDICGLCGCPGAVKPASPPRWDNQIAPDRPYVHAECEGFELHRALNDMTPSYRRQMERERRL